jgi:hypothetical protein
MSCLTAARSSWKAAKLSSEKAQIIEHISLDGVIQVSDEDGGFSFARYFCYNVVAINIQRRT